MAKPDDGSPEWALLVGMARFFQEAAREVRRIRACSKERKQPKKAPAAR